MTTNHDKGVQVRRGPGFFLLAALLSGILVAGLFFYFYRKSPRYAVDQMAAALASRNYEAFSAYLDLPAIAAQLAESGGQELFATLPQAPGFLKQLGRQLGGQVTRQVVPRLLEVVEPELHRLLKQYVAGLTGKEVTQLAEALRRARVERIGEEALVTVKLPPQGLPLRFTLAWDGFRQRWRVVAVSYEDVKEVLHKGLF